MEGEGRRGDGKKGEANQSGRSIAALNYDTIDTLNRYCRISINPWQNLTRWNPRHG